MKNKVKRKLIVSGVGALICLLYMLFASVPAVMDAARLVSGHIRNIIATFTSIVPFSVYEICIIAAVLLIIIHIIRSTIYIAHSKGERIFAAIKQVLTLVNSGLFVIGAMLWLWGSLYNATPFYIGKLSNTSPSVNQLSSALEYYIGKANEAAPNVSRDAGGHIIIAAKQVLSDAAFNVSFDELGKIFPLLGQFHNRTPKPMMFSEFMSITHFEGVYFALTGEANLNIGTPLMFLPAAASHELTHAQGIAAEDETSFIGIVVSTMSLDPVFSYSGYLTAVTKLGNALYEVDRDAYFKLAELYGNEIRVDFNDNAQYWGQYKDNTVSQTVNSVYDGYLRSNGQELGMRSYDACVNLLVSWYEQYEKS